MNTEAKDIEKGTGMTVLESWFEEKMRVQRDEPRDC